MWVCNSFLKSTYTYFNFRIFYQYSGPLDFFEAFLQNTLSNVLNFNNIYQSIVNKQARGDMAGVWFDLARLIRITIDFKPVEAAGRLMSQIL